MSARFDTFRNTVRPGLALLAGEGLVTSSRGLGGEVRSQEVFELNASRFGNLEFPQRGDACNTDVTNAGRRPHRRFRAEMLPVPAEVAERLETQEGSKAVLRFRHRYVDDVPWSTRATCCPVRLVGERPRPVESGDIEEGTTRYPAASGIERIGYFDEVATRMPTPEESRLAVPLASSAPPSPYPRPRPPRPSLVSEVTIGESAGMLLPLTHGKTELIEVIRITDPVRHLRSENLTGDTAAIWEGNQAHQALSLIADLPGSELYRCFLPGWGIRAHSSTDQLFEIAFCFRCHGARIWGPGLPVEQQGQTFDAESPAALELLHRFRSCLPD